MLPKHKVTEDRDMAKDDLSNAATLAKRRTEMALPWNRFCRWSCVVLGVIALAKGLGFIDWPEWFGFAFAAVLCTTLAVNMCINRTPRPSGSQPKC